MTNVNVARTTFSTYAEKSTGLLSADAFRSALDSIDPARYGRLTSTSFGIAANALGLSPEETEQALRAFDADGDGLVETAAIVAAASGMAGNDALWSFDEFAAFLPNTSPPVSAPGLSVQSDELVATPKVLAKAVEADDAEDASAHSVLFAASFSPGPLGSLASLADAGLYGLEQNWSEAGMSAAAAVLGIGMDAGIANVGLRTGLKVLNPVKDAAYYAANDFIRNPLILAGKSADEIVEIAQNFGYKVEIQAQKGTNAIVIKNVGDSVGRTTLKDIDKAIKNGDPIPDLEFSSVKLNFGQNGHSKVDAFGDKVNNTYIEVKTNSDIFDGKGIFKVVNKDTYTSDMQAGVKLFDYELNSVPVAVVDRLGQKVGEWVPTSSPLVTHPRPVMTAAQTNALAINAAERAASGNLMPLNALEQIEFKEIYDTLMAANKLTDGEAIRYAGSFFTRDNEGALAFLRQNYDKIGVGGETFQSLMRTYQSQLTTSGDFKPANWVGAMMLASFGDPSTGGSGTGPVVSAGQPPHVTTGPSVLGALSADPSIATAQKVGTAINDGALNVSDLQTYLNEANQAVDAFMSSKAPVEAIVSHARSAVANAEAALNRATDAMAGLASVASPAEYGAAMTVLAQARQVLTATSLALENAGGAYNAALQAGMSARDAVASTWKPIASNLTTLAGATKTLITDTYQRAMLLTTDAQKLVIAASVEKIASAAHSGSTLAVVAEEFIAANSKAEIVVATGLKALLSNDTLTRILYGEPFAKGLQLLGAGLGLVGVQQGMNNILQAVDTGAPIKVADILGVAGATLGTFAGLIVLGGATLSAPFTIAGGLVVTGADLIIGSVLLDAAKIAASTYNVSIGGETAVPARDLPAAVNEFVPELVPDTSGTTGPDDVTFPDGGDGRIADAFTGIEHTGSGLTEWQASDPVTNEPYGPSVLLPIGEDPDKYYTNGQWNLAGTQTQVYMAALAEGQNVGEAVATAAMVSAPQNAGVLNYLATHRAQIVNGQIPLSAAIANATTPSNPLPIRRPDEAALVATNNARLAQGIPVLDAAGQRDFRTVYTQAVTGGKSDGDARRIAGNLLKPESQDKLDYFKGRAGELATGKPGVTVDTIIADYKPAANSEAAQIKAISQRVNAPDILAYTGEKRTDFLNIYNWLTQNEGKTDKEAADFARTLLLDKNAATLRSLKREDNLARIAGGEKIASVAAEIELDVTTLTVLNDNLNAQIGLARAAGNDAGVLLLTATQGVVSMGLANARASTASLGIAGAVKELAATTGKSFSQIMKMIGEGDLMAFGAVIEDLGKVYEATIGGNEMSLAGTSLRSTGDAMYALGVQQKNVDLQASGKMMSGLGDFFAGIGGKGATTATGIGGAASFMGSITSGIGLLTGDNALVGAGNTIMSAAGVLGGGSSITNLIKRSQWHQAI